MDCRVRPGNDGTRTTDTRLASRSRVSLHSTWATKLDCFAHARNDVNGLARALLQAQFVIARSETTKQSRTAAKAKTTATFTLCVTTGLDPVVHADPPSALSVPLSKPRPRMDCRVEPGNDDMRNRRRRLNLVIARSETTKQSRTAATPRKCSRLLRGDCHRIATSRDSVDS